MKYCRGCGFPVPYGKFLEWTSDGTILGKEKTRTRLVYLWVEEIRNLFNSVSSWIGVSIEPIICRAEKEVGRRFITALAPGFIAKMPRGKVARPEFGVKAASHFIFNYMGGLGMGRAEIIEYRSGESARIGVSDVHSVPLVAGDGAGVFEHLERVGVEATWQRLRTDEYIINISKVSDEPPGAGRLSLEQEVYIPGTVRFDNCRQCGVPREVTNNIYLDLDRGVLRNKITGVREVALPAQSFHAVFRELHAEFGEQLPPFMEGVEQKFLRENSSAKMLASAAGTGELVAILSDFPWRGLGNPTMFNYTGTGAEVVIENPFHPEMVAGRVAGTYESWTGTPVRTSWVQDAQGRLLVTLTRL